MTTDFKEIANSALKLDENHRAELAKRLLSSLDHQIDQEIEQAWIDEVNHRKKELNSGEVAPISAEEVLSNARKMLQK